MNFSEFFSRRNLIFLVKNLRILPFWSTGAVETLPFELLLFGWRGLQSAQFLKKRIRVQNLLRFLLFRAMSLKGFSQVNKNELTIPFLLLSMKGWPEPPSELWDWFLSFWALLKVSRFLFTFCLNSKSNCLFIAEFRIKSFLYNY